MSLDHLTSAQIYEVEQQLIWGATPREVQYKLGIAPEDIAEIIARSQVLPQDNHAARKQLALARIDMLGKVAIAHGSKGDMQAIKTWIELQKREAALTGMDAAQKQDTTVKVELSWVNANRLAYKDKAQLASDIASRASDVSFVELPVNPPQATTPPAIPSDGHQTDP